MQLPILVGAVVYDPKVVVIWDIIKEFFINESCPMDYVFYSNYELMVEALVAGHIHIAWNSPLAWLEAEHETAGDGLFEIRRLSSNYVIPADACNTFAVFYKELKEFEEDLHKHVHLENNILFPRSIELEELIINSKIG